LNNPFESIDPGDLAQNWRDKAACLGTFTELFYYVNGSGRVHTEVAAALDICGTCTVTRNVCNWLLIPMITTPLWVAPRQPNAST